jgi:hypothetical protein
MGVLANHVPSIEQLRPGLIEVIEEAGGSKQFFCSFGTSKEWNINTYEFFSVWWIRRRSTRFKA